MKNMKVLIWCLIVLVFLPCVTISSLNFPNIIWVYWETDFQKAPLITRVSYEKLILAAKEVNWTVTLVTGKTIHQYISNIQEFSEVVKKGKRQTVQEKSDLLRIWLIQENGGVWIDFALIPLQNFSWLKDYSSYQHMIINRMGTNLDDPNMLMLGEGWHQSPLSEYNSEGALVADEYFGMAIHFIAAKKKVPIMTDWKNKMKTISSLTYKQMLPEWKKYRLFFHNIDRTDVYYSGNIALESTLQLKQLQLDKNLTLFSKHLSVYEHYKIWCIHGEVGPIGFTRGHALKTSDFFMFTRQEVEERAGLQRFYIKIPAYLRSGIQGQLSRTRQYLDQKNKTVEQIIKDGPTPEECYKLFIVEGSILHNFYQGSKYFEQLKVPIITIKQRDILRQKCISVNPDVYKPIYQVHSTGSLVSPEREMYAKDTSIKTQLWVWWVTHSLSINEWMEKYRGPVLLITLYAVLKLFFGSFLKSLANRNNDSINLQPSQQSDHPKNQFLKLNAIITLAFVSLMYMVFYQLFQCIQYHGKFPLYNYIAFMSVVIIGINEFVKRQTDNFGKTGGSWFVPLQTINLVSRMFLLIYTGHCVLMHFHIMWFYAYRDVLLIIGMGYLLCVIFFQMQKRKLVDNKFHKWIVNFMESILPWSIVGFFCLVTVWRNPMYLISGDHYIRLGFINFLSAFFNLFSKFSIGYFLIVLTNNVIISFKSEQSQKNISPRLLRQQSIIFILSSIYWLITYTIIANKYEGMEENFDSFDHILHMKYFMLHFAVLQFAIRLKMPQQLELKYKITLYILSFTYTILFCVFGFELFRYLFANDFKKKVHFCILTFLLALLALVWEVFTNQQRQQSIQKIIYQEPNEYSQISMSDLKIQG